MFAIFVRTFSLVNIEFNTLKMNNEIEQVKYWYENHCELVRVKIYTLWTNVLEYLIKIRTKAFKTNQVTLKS
jgi:hypothetical protein